jgi:HAD superfamily hydrolase (TIGR01509 family)
LATPRILSDPQPAPPFAAIFDFDGVVLDSETPEFESYRATFEAYGAVLALEEWTASVGIWRPGIDWYDVLCARTVSFPERSTFEAERRQRFLQGVRMEPLPGIVALLDDLRARRVATAIASSASSRWVHRAVGEVGLLDRFDAIVTGDQVARLKPAPDVYLEAARRLGVEPESAVAIEDSATGLASAKSAGLAAIVIPHWLTAGHDLSAADLRVAHAGELDAARLAGIVRRRQRKPDGPA